MRNWYKISFTPDHATNSSTTFESVTDLMIDGKLFSCILEETYQKGVREALTNREIYYWLKSCKMATGEGLIQGYTCSCCNHLTDNPTMFCPNCGAKMKMSER